MEFFIVIGFIVVLAVVGTLYQRRQERNMLERIKRAGHNPNLIMGELDRDIQLNQENAEFWKKQSGKIL
jgi:hypothetical protein